MFIFKCIEFLEAYKQHVPLFYRTNNNWSFCATFVLWLRDKTTAGHREVALACPEPLVLKHLSLICVINMKNGQTFKHPADAGNVLARLWSVSRSHSRKLQSGTRRYQDKQAPWKRVCSVEDLEKSNTPSLCPSPAACAASCLCSCSPYSSHALRRPADRAEWTSASGPRCTCSACFVFCYQKNKKYKNIGARQSKNWGRTALEKLRMTSIQQHILTKTMSKL